MAFVLPENVQETSTSTSSPYTLLGAVAGRAALGSQLSNGDTTLLAIGDGTDLEVGIYTYSNTSGQQVTLSSVIYSTNGGSPVPWSAGTRNVIAALPGEVLASLLDPAMALGLLVKIADRSYAARTIDVDTDDLQIANPAGTAGNPTLALAFTVSTFIKTLLDDANAAAARATLAIPPNVLLGSQSSTGTSAGNSTYWGFNGLGALSTTLVDYKKDVCPLAGTLKNFYFRAGINAADANAVVNLLIDGAASGITVTVTAGSIAVFSDTTHTAAITAGQLLTIQIDGTSITTGSLQHCSWGVQLE